MYNNDVSGLREVYDLETPFGCTPGNPHTLKHVTVLFFLHAGVDRVSRSFYFQYFQVYNVMRATEIGLF